MLIALLGWAVDWSRTGEILARSDVGLLAVALAINVLAIVISTLKWARLIRITCGPIAFWQLLRAYWIGTFFNNYLPSSVGGDVARVLTLGPVVSSSAAAASVVAERMTGVIALAVLSAICLLLQPPGRLHLTWSLWLLIGVVLGVSVLLCTGGGRLIAFGTHLARSSRLFARVLSKLSNLANALGAYRRTPGEVTIAFVWSFAFYATLAVFQFTLLRAVGSTIGFAQAALVAPLIPLLSLLPVTANGLGIAEGAFVIFYTHLGVAPDQAFAAALLRRLVTIFIAVPGGLMWLGAGSWRRATA